jgi:hypothetical protein
VPAPFKLGPPLFVGESRRTTIKGCMMGGNRRKHANSAAQLGPSKKQRSVASSRYTFAEHAPDHPPALPSLSLQQHHILPCLSRPPSLDHLRIDSTQIKRLLPGDYPMPLPSRLGLAYQQTSPLPCLRCSFSMPTGWPSPMQIGYLLLVFWRMP